MLGEQVRDSFLAGLPERSIGLHPEEFGCLFVLGLQADGVAVGELDNQAGEFEEWVGFGSGSDLLGDSFNGCEFGNQLKLPSFQERLGRGFRPAIALVAWTSAVIAISSAFATRCTCSSGAAGASVLVRASATAATIFLTGTTGTVCAIGTSSPIGSWSARVTSTLAVAATTAETIGTISIVKFCSEMRRAVGGLGCPRRTENIGEVDPQRGKIGGCFGVVAHGKIRKESR
jgi:hypothetical protein